MASLLRESRTFAKIIWFQVFMHFSFYVMVAALALLGVEAAYALYQLTLLVL
jgi:multidrug transporter EmrE-like cation transporter